MKSTILLLSASLLLASCAETTTANGDTTVSDEEALGNGYDGTQWHSNELGYSWNKNPNTIVLTFYRDSVEFNLPGGDGILAGDLLKTKRATTPKRVTVPYEVDGNEVILDPGITGYSIHMERAGDSLVWKGGLTPGVKAISLRRK